MLHVVPQSWLSWNFDVYEGAHQVAEIKVSTLPERGTFSIDGTSFRARREGMFSGEFFLEDGSENRGENGDQIIARAQKPSALLKSFEIQYSDRSYKLKKESVVGRAFLLLEGDREVGSIRPEGFLSRKAAALLPAEMPRPVQVFVIWLTILMWRRDANAGASAAASTSSST
ncbi:MAG TPA: hypothetical protein VE178_05350 [Silvibacterium sp.]|nr:hypothetical protein [Silvibacterium sp.]